MPMDCLNGIILPGFTTLLFSNEESQILYAKMLTLNATNVKNVVFHLLKGRGGNSIVILYFYLKEVRKRTALEKMCFKTFRNWLMIMIQCLKKLPSE